jgi:hypothetical protein
LAESEQRYPIKHTFLRQAKGSESLRRPEKSQFLRPDGSAGYDGVTLARPLGLMWKAMRDIAGWDVEIFQPTNQWPLLERG